MYRGERGGQSRYSGEREDGAAHRGRSTGTRVYCWGSVVMGWRIVGKIDMVIYRVLDPCSVHELVLWGSGLAG